MSRSLSTLLRESARLAVSRRARRNAWFEWQRRLGGEPGLPPPPIRRVLLVCHGNLCRSPYAAARLAVRLPEHEVRSSGLAARGGEPADADALRAAARAGVSLDAHRTRPFKAEDAAWADLLLVMEGHHVARLLRKAPEAEAQTRLLGHFLEAPPYHLEDPWGEPDAVFDSVFARIDQAVAALAARIEAAG